MKTWKKHHPTWEYKLWTDEDVDSFPWGNKAAFLKATNLAMKADLWRLEILYKIGGLYVDCDMECIRPLDPIHSRFEGYFGIDRPDVFYIANSLMAMKPRTYIGLLLLLKAKANMELITDMSKITDDILPGAAGPTMVTDVIGKIRNLHRHKFHIFPCEYFQPVLPWKNGISSTERESKNMTDKCFAIHYNGCSWMGKDFFSK